MQNKNMFGVERLICLNQEADKQKHRRVVEGRKVKEHWNILSEVFVVFEVHLYICVTFLMMMFKVPVFVFLIYMKSWSGGCSNKDFTLFISL